MCRGGECDGGGEEEEECLWPYCDTHLYLTSTWECVLGCSAALVAGGLAHGGVPFPLFCIRHRHAVSGVA